MKIIVFSIESQNYGIDINRVNSILQYVKPTPVPNSHNSVSGVINVRGEIHTILDGADILNGTIKEEDSRVILLDNSSKIGLHVQNTSNVLNISDEDISRSNALLGYEDTNYIKQVINHNNEIIIELDIDKIVSNIM